MNFFFLLLFFQFNSKNFLRGLKFRWGVFKGARGGGFGVGRFKRGADLEHNQKGYPLHISGAKYIYSDMCQSLKYNMI